MRVNMENKPIGWLVDVEKTIFFLSSLWKELWQFHHIASVLD